MGTTFGNALSSAQPYISASLVPELSAVYANFAALTALAAQRFQGELGGRLLLHGRLDAAGAAIALAANIAGAATLGVDPDTDRLRQAIRHGYCDFVVNHLDEALRILKNEVRKKQPVSVGLEANLAATLSEAVERGLQPDLLALAGITADAEILVQRGALALDLDRAESDPSLAGVAWTAESAAALWLPKADALAAKVLPAGDARLRWLKFAPRYLGRTMAGRRYLRMTAGEAERFAALVAEATATGAIGTHIRIQAQE